MSVDENGYFDGKNLHNIHSHKSMDFNSMCMQKHCAVAI